MLTRESILNKTHYGLNIYSYVLRQYYKDETVLSLSGRDCQPAKNPFNNDKTTLMVKISEECAIHSDADSAIEPGDAFDFASLFFGLSGQNLTNKLNESLFLRIDQGATFSGQVRQHYDGSEASIIKEASPVFSYFAKPISNLTPTFETDLLEVYNFIKGDRYYKNTDTLRKKKDVDDARKYKAKSFDYVTFSGTFSRRHDSSLESHSGLIVLDFDHVKDITTLKTALLKDVYFETGLLFVSPSGDGLKWVISIDLKQADQYVYFKALTNYFQQTYNIEIDRSGKNVSRACFLPHDPHVYINPKYL